MDRRSSKKEIAWWIHIIVPVFWIILFGMQDLFCIISPVLPWAELSYMGTTLMVPMVVSIPLLVLFIIEIANLKFLEENLSIFMVADITGILIFSAILFAWATVMFTAMAFAEGYGLLPYVMEVHVFYIVVVPIISIVSIVILLVTYLIYRFSKGD